MGIWPGVDFYMLTHTVCQAVSGEKESRIAPLCVYPHSPAAFARVLTPGFFWGFFWQWGARAHLALPPLALRKWFIWTRVKDLGTETATFHQSPQQAAIGLWTRYCRGAATRQ